MDIITVYSQGSNLDRSAVNVGNALSKAEDRLGRAFSLDESNKSGVDKLAKELGAPKGTTLEGLRLLAKHALDKASSVYEMLSQLFAQRKRTQDQVIQNIGR
ncbi:MAG: hypothetical protein DCC75_09635 [Proteobacteria bacterium]|nr:MAG: hypothetical protein DCC75_09635 [Pseudomonadota bacterium]